MNITQETDDYLSTTENWKQFVKEYKFEKNYNPLDNCKTNSNLKDKLKTTPDPGINRISKVFRVDWSEIFKRGWLLWK